ncbi:aromatic ring-opening dioxygenase LigA [Actinotalea sp.]|uniref:aromatic ring-opening dioxygenase LigA n=1 Tax=Actinotalea sp. TaxID=1872145 RepID=UPI00356B5615
MSTVNAKPVKIVSYVLMVVGLLMVVAGGVTWGLVSSQLAAENITVSDDATAFAGSAVDGPLQAFYQADVINTHALASTDGKTYAELDREDPLRATAMNASFLRASLFTSVVAFGVAAFAIGVGLVLILIGYAFTAVLPKKVEATAPTAAV